MGRWVASTTATTTTAATTAITPAAATLATTTLGNRNASDNDYDCGRDRHGSGMNIIILQKTLFKSVELVPMWPGSPSASQCPYVRKVLCRSGVLRGTD